MIVIIQASGLEKPEPGTDFCHEGGENDMRENRNGGVVSQGWDIGKKRGSEEHRSRKNL